MRSRGRLGLAAAVLASLGALLVGPMAAAQSSSENMLAIRGIDATNRDAVKVTFLYTGEPEDLKALAIREDGATKEVTDLTNLRKTDERLGTVYVVDLSGSMEKKGGLTAVKKGMQDVVDNLPEGDEMAIVSFSDAAVTESGFTDDKAQLRDAIDAMAAPRDGKRATWDGLRRATKLFATRDDLQPNLVLVSNGKDDASTSTLESARASIISSGAALFTVELDNGEGADTAAYKTIMDRTGGASFQGTGTDGTQQAFTDLNATMQSQYVATYPSTARQGQVDVSVGVGSLERQASYVAGASVQGAGVTQVVAPPKPFGPAWMRGKAGGALALALVGLAVGLGAFAAVSLVTAGDESLNAVLRPYAEGPVNPEDHDAALAQTALLQRAVELTEEFAERQGFLVKVERALERADLPLRAAEALFFYLAGAILLTLLAFTLAGFMGGFVLGLVALLLPPAFVNFKAARRGKKFESALPDTLQLLSGSLRAGYSLPRASRPCPRKSRTRWARSCAGSSPRPARP
ncbi:MAG: VWA domain-containing protein [Acidimicrobiales bacterium]